MSVTKEINLPYWNVVYGIPNYTYDKHGNFKKLKKMGIHSKGVHAATEKEARKIVQDRLDSDGAQYPELSGGKVIEVTPIEIINRQIF